MSTPTAGSAYEQPSLVPLADMLANTVGVMLFILIFVVLAAGGAVVPKRLPIEQTTDKRAVFIMCAGDRVIAADISALADQFHQQKVRPLGEPTFRTVEDWSRRYERLQFEHPDFELRPSSLVQDMGLQKNLNASLRFLPRAGAGESAAEAGAEGSRFAITLAATRAGERFIFFFVRPDSIAAFLAARELAIARGIQTGWMPLGLADPASIGLIGSGRRATIN